MGTHYDTLGVRQGSTTQEIRKAYLRRARALHPDRQLGRSETDARRAEQAMQQVNVAWNVLSDPAKKSDYDKSLGGRATAPKPTAQATKPTQAPPRPAAQRTTSTARSQSQPRQRSIDDEPGDGSVSVWASMPVLIILGVVLGILIVVAFSGDQTPEPIPDNQNNATLDIGDCFVLDGNVPRERSCALGVADGKVIATGPEPGNCPGNTQSMPNPRSDFFLCWAEMIPGSSETVPPDS